jgi:hypothetical protein
VARPRPNNWEQLYDHYRGAESRRREEELRHAEELQALEDFEAWSRSSTEQLMADLREAANQRSESFSTRTGHELSVEYPSGPPITVPEGGPEIRFLRLALGAARVHLYSSHTPGGLIHIHLLPSRQTSLSHNQRLLSEPGAFLVRLENNAYELRHLPGDPEGEQGTPMTLDGLLFKAFRLLVNWAEAGLPSPSR